MATAPPVLANGTGEAIQPGRALPSAAPTQNAPVKLDPLTIRTDAVAVSPFTIPLPATWQHVLLTEQHREEQLKMVSMANATFVPLVARFLDGRATDQALFIAWPTTEAAGIGLVGYLIPRGDLSLQRYLTAATQNLNSMPKVTLHEAAIRYTIRDDVPVGYLHYTVAATGADNSKESGEDDITGHQYLLFDEPAEALLLLTFFTEQSSERTTLLPTPTADQRALVHAGVVEAPFADIIQAVIRQPSTTP